MHSNNHYILHNLIVITKTNWGPFSRRTWDSFALQLSKCKRVKNTTLYIWSCPSNSSLKRVVVLFNSFRVVLLGQSQKIPHKDANFNLKSGRPLKKELSLISLFKECFWNLLHLKRWNKKATYTPYVGIHWMLTEHGAMLEVGWNLIWCLYLF